MTILCPNCKKTSNCFNEDLYDTKANTCIKCGYLFKSETELYQAHKNFQQYSQKTTEEFYKFLNKENK